MKKNILTILIGILAFSAINAQGNLQFNQVVNNSYVTALGTSSYTTYNLGNVVVPSGKVLKLESGSITSLGSTIYLASGRATIGDQLIWASTGSTNYTTEIYPLWLSEGTYAVRYMPTSTSSLSYSVNISGIEFNIIP